MIFREAVIQDLAELSAIEAVCFPPNEAADRDTLERRLKTLMQHFIVLEDEKKKLMGFINGMVTEQPDLADEMYQDMTLHNEKGDWQMIFGLDILPAYRHRGYASWLLRRMIIQAKEQGRKGLVLTCKAHLMPFYQRFGFVNEGLSSSVHGHVTWYQMRLTFPEMVLPTSRLALRNFQLSDLDVLFQYRHDERCSKYQEWSDCSRDQLRHMIESHLHDTLLHGQTTERFVICSHDRTLLGDISLYYSPSDQCVTLSYTIRPEYQRQGYAYEILQAVIKEIQKAWSQLDIVVLIHPANIPSIKLAEKLGFCLDTYVQRADSLIYVIPALLGKKER